MKVSENLLTELAERVDSLTNYWSPSDTQADYICVFCGTRAKTNIAPIEHTNDCIGIRFLRIFRA
jgi:hypothetical protein